MMRLALFTVFACLTITPVFAQRGDAWPRHTIDDSSRGADGVRLLDVNGDDLPDVATGWEEGGKIRVYLHPSQGRVKLPWPAVTVGNVRSPEDAVLVDLDGDGAAEVVSCCEGRERAMYVHWSPGRVNPLHEQAWKTAGLPDSRGKLWMFCLPLDVDGRHGPDLVAGAKGEGAQIGWWEAPEDPLDFAAWRWHALYEAGWIMSLEAHDMDGDGDLDVVASDRKGRNRGLLWLDNPGPAGAGGDWEVHRIGPGGEQVMFLDLADWDGDGLTDVLAAVSGGDTLWLRRTSADGKSWEQHTIPRPENTGTGKSVRVCDVDLDGRLDLVYSCENASGDKSGVVWMSKNTSGDGWQTHEISGPRGVKFDLLQLLDIDGDGDTDVMTCEERENLGVIWYENPTKPGQR